MTRWLRLWFGSMPVGRGAYAASGFGLAAFKYACDASAVYALTGHFWKPLDYLSPLFSQGSAVIGRASPWASTILLIWTLPFLWIGASMSVRRALHAGLPAWSGLLFFVPALNYLWMLVLCVVPEGTRQPPTSAAPTRFPRMRAAAISGSLGVAVCAFAVFGPGGYGAGLFLGTPFVMGFVAAYLLNRSGDFSELASQGTALLSLAFASLALLLFALEGLMCLIMAAPIAIAVAALGAALGRSAARLGPLRPAQGFGVLLALPISMGVEGAAPEPPLREVASAIEIDAPPEQVWPYVVGFSELPPPSRLVFELGIAHPIRARIEGHGVGAVRYCEFSTGPFVEPITAWDEPRRLAFDVASQPEPMHETSPYQHVHAPHLIAGLVSRRGEFRLVPLDDGRTRLEGSTWYQLRMRPQPYWSLYSDFLIGAIHERVLEHVKRLAEASRA